MTVTHVNNEEVKGHVLTAAEWNAAHSIAGFDSSGAITLSGDGLVILEFRPDLDFEKIRGNTGIPTRVYRGLSGGFSLPVFNDDNEELYFELCMPNRWDGESNITVHVYCWLAGNEDSKNFKLRLSWEHHTIGDNVPESSNNVDVQTATGASALAGDSYKADFTIDYDIDTPDDIIADDLVNLRLRRIAASANDCAGEIVIEHVGVIVTRDKIGSAVP